MSTGPQHYRRAEDWAARAVEVMDQIGALGPVVRTEDVVSGSAQVQNLLAAAQVHATLALVAATTLSPVAPGYTSVELDAWRAAFAGEESDR